MIPTILDIFRIQGPNSTHACYVTRPARISLSDAKEWLYVRLFRLEIARALVAQLAIAVEYIHTRGFVHGDIHSGNMLLRLPFELDGLSDEGLYQEYNEPQSEVIARFDGKKVPSCIHSHGILLIWLRKASEDLSLPEAKILLSDFGEAFCPRKEAPRDLNLITLLQIEPQRRGLSPCSRFLFHPISGPWPAQYGPLSLNVHCLKNSSPVRMT